MRKYKSKSYTNELYDKFAELKGYENLPEYIKSRKDTGAVRGEISAEVTEFLEGVINEEQRKAIYRVQKLKDQIYAIISEVYYSYGIQEDAVIDREVRAAVRRLTNDLRDVEERRFTEYSEIVENLFG